MYSLMTMLIAGALSTIAFDFFGQSLSPALGFANLAPVPLAQQTIGTLMSQYYPDVELAANLQRAGGHFLHYLAGMIAYPLGWMLVADPLRKVIVPRLGWFVPAVVYGIVLWVFALFIMAHLINGNPAFLGFTGITWVALIGHILFAVVTAWVVAWRGSRRYGPASVAAYA